MKKFQRLLCLTAFVAMGTFFLAGSGGFLVSANNTPQTLPFSQNWTDTTLISMLDDWSLVPGIIGYRGDDLTTLTGVDPRTILVDGSSTPVDVNDDQTNPDTFTTGGVAEFEIANPTIALNGSGTADAPHIVIHLNTTGQSSINFQCNLRDLDASADNAIMQVDVQYRVGGTGNYASVPGGYFADVTTGGTATQVTPVNVTLPFDANNAALVEIRVITTNAVGNDEWVGVDDISVSGGKVVPVDAPVDFDGDGRTDFVITRDTNTPVAGLLQKYWYISTNGSTDTSVVAWGLQGDAEVPVDFDGDGKDDVAIWRHSGTPDPGSYYILQSESSTVRIETFGLSGDDIGVTGDYDGDGKADPATFRCPSTPGQCTFFYRGSLSNPGGNITYIPWGFGTDSTIIASPGDFDGDGKFDFCVRRDVGGGAAQFVLNRSSDSGIEYISWGLTSDVIIPGDFDGDGTNDFCVVRLVGNQAHWYILERDGGGTGAAPIIFGDPTQDFGAWGDYDGDGRQDIAVWRPNADPTMNFFFIRQSSNGALLVKEWGQMGDRPVAEWNGRGGSN